MKQEIFNICVDDDCVDIIDWISSHFKDGNWDKNFEVTVTLKEIDWGEDGEIFYIDKEESI